MATRPGEKQRVRGNSRRVPLGDIGNLITIHVDRFNRPATKTLGSQLQEQAAKGENKNKKQVPIPGRKAVPCVAKVVQKSENVIEISPDTVDAKIDCMKCSPDVSSKKRKTHTYTSVLTARAKDRIVDIDAADATNQLAAVEYVEDLFKFYKIVERSSTVHDYMDSQPEINMKMRSILVDWLIEVHNKFDLTPETLYLTIYILDRFLSIKAVSRQELQLVGISSMLIASKYEEIWAPAVNDFVCICDRAYTREQVLVMEKSILQKLEWNVTVPTPYVFLARFTKAALADQEMENMVFFYAELGLMNYATILYCPSMLSASAVYAARCTLNKTPLWNETLKFHTGYADDQLIDCAKVLVNLHAGLTMQKLQVVRRKYSSPQLNVVALLPPAKNLMA